MLENDAEIYSHVCGHNYRRLKTVTVFFISYILLVKHSSANGSSSAAELSSPNTLPILQELLYISTGAAIISLCAHQSHQTQQDYQYLHRYNICQN